MKLPHIIEEQPRSQIFHTKCLLSTMRIKRSSCFSNTFFQGRFAAKLSTKIQKISQLYKNSKSQEGAPPKAAPLLFLYFVLIFGIFVDEFCGKPSLKKMVGSVRILQFASLSKIKDVIKQATTGDFRVLIEVFPRPRETFSSQIFVVEKGISNKILCKRFQSWGVGGSTIMEWPLDA